MKAKAQPEIDLWDHGPLRRADGQQAYNSHFWPMEGDSYWYREFDGLRPYSLDRAHALDWIGVIELNNGNWMAGHGIARITDPQYPSREAAFRAQCDQVMKRARNELLRPLRGDWDRRTVTSEIYGKVASFVAWVLKTEEANGWARRIEPEEEA